MTTKPYSTEFQIFSPQQIASLRKNGKILRECLAHTATFVAPGVRTEELDAVAEKFIRDHGGIPAFKGLYGFPKTLCISLNDEVVHGIPGPRRLKEGDIVSLDGGVVLDDLFTDACITVPVGRIDPKVQQFLDTTRSILDDVIASLVRPGTRIGDISSFIQRRLEDKGHAPVRVLVGHGLGTTLHQFPDVPNFGKAGTGPVLPAHTMIAIEPIAVIGRQHEVVTADDQWTIRTKDGSMSCHFEHSVLITEEGCEVIA